MPRSAVRFHQCDCFAVECFCDAVAVGPLAQFREGGFRDTGQGFGRARYQALVIAAGSVNFVSQDIPQYFCRLSELPLPGSAADGFARYCQYRIASDQCSVQVEKRHALFFGVVLPDCFQVSF